MDIRKGKHGYPFQAFRKNAKLFFIVIAVLLFIFLLNHFKISHYFPIKTVHIYGADRTDHDQMKTLLTPLVNHGFFNVNIDLIRDRLLQLPWVGDVFVRRNWPDKLEINVKEKKATALWNKQGLLSDHGEIFTPTLDTYPGNLPIFYGPTGKQMIMLQYFNEMNRLLLPLHAKISWLEFTSYNTWKVKLDSGVVLQMGYKDILEHLYHFVKVYPKVIGKRATDVDYIDLRYSNGMAVQWKSPIKT